MNSRHRRTIGAAPDASGSFTVFVGYGTVASAAAAKVFQGAGEQNRWAQDLRNGARFADLKESSPLRYLHAWYVNSRCLRSTGWRSHIRTRQTTKKG